MMEEPEGNRRKQEQFEMKREVEEKINQLMTHLGVFFERGGKKRSAKRFCFTESVEEKIRRVGLSSHFSFS